MQLNTRGSAATMGSILPFATPFAMDRFAEKQPFSAETLAGDDPSMTAIGLKVFNTSAT